MSNQLQTYVDSQIAEISPYKLKSNVLLSDAELQDVTDAKSAKEAAVLRKNITAHKKLVADARMDITRQFDDVKKQFIKAEKDVLEPAEEAQELIQGKMLAYEEEEAKRREAEEERIAGIVARFEVRVDELTDEDAIADRLEEVKKINETLSDDDRELPQVKLAYAEAKNILLQRKDELTLGADTDDAEVASTEAERNDAIEEAEQAAKAAAKAEPKVGIKTVTRFEIIDAEAVPRELCEPSEKLIREAVKKGVAVIPGVRIWSERSF